MQQQKEFICICQSYRKNSWHVIVAHSVQCSYCSWIDTDMINCCSSFKFLAVLCTRKTSSPPKNTSSPSGYLSFLLVKPEPLATSSPLSAAVTTADLACTGQETWRAESLLQVTEI